MKIIKTFMLLTVLTGTLHAQEPGWEFKDLKTDSVYGISIDKAAGILKNKKGKKVIVAVIDSGIDTAHKDFSGILWTNPKEKHLNGLDDDKNKYADDHYGWNFIGSKKGNVRYENKEITRLVRTGKKKYKEASDRADSAGYAQYLSHLNAFYLEVQKARISFQSTNGMKMIIDSMLVQIGKSNPTLAEWNAYQPRSVNQASLKSLVRNRMKETKLDFADFKQREIELPLQQFRQELDFALNLDFDPRGIVGDDPENPEESAYGSSDVTGPDAKHGTHVAGIIANTWRNGKGAQDAAVNLKIMAVRAVPDGDERDKDIANAIRYAVDNGATIINMSFGKPYSNHKQVVDEAVRYALRKDVLIIHAAGNSFYNLDRVPNFPNKRYAGGQEVADAWIEVGASLPKAGRSALVAGFSNYGKQTVDLFAPGAAIYSTIPGSRYESLDGTSMAAPVVAGIAGLLRSNYPSLKAWQIKEILMQTVITSDASALLVQESRQEKFSNMSVSGGIVNAFEAVKLAELVTAGGQKIVRRFEKGSTMLLPATNRQQGELPDSLRSQMPAPRDSGAVGATPSIAGIVVPQEENRKEIVTVGGEAVFTNMEEYLKSVEYNKAAPSFVLPDLDGATIRLEDLKGKVVVIDFWATWCVPCIKSFPQMQKAQEAYRDDPGVKFLFIHTMNRVDSATAMVRHFLERTGYPFHVLMDLADPVTHKSPVFQSFHLTGLPSKVVIDPNGVIRFMTSGWGADEGKGEREINKMKAMIEAAKRK